MGEVFISYKQDERDRMRPIADGLRALGVDVWFDERLQPDRSFTEEIHQVMSTCKAQIVCWSPLAVASEWVRGEAEVARQRGVLVAVMIEPCVLLPPFNMHHAESLVGWSGDPKHTGWRKVCDAIGRRVDRLGLGELAVLQGSTDAAAWKKWAQKFPNDPSADAAWAIAEELEVSGARERMARDRETAKRVAGAETEKRRAPSSVSQAAAAVVPSEQTTTLPQRRGSRARILIVTMGALILVGGGATAYFLWPRDSLLADEPQANALSPSPEQTVPSEPSGAALAHAAPAASLQARPIAPVPAESNPARSALDALNRIGPREWLTVPESELRRRVLAESSRDSLRAAAEADPRAQTLLYWETSFSKEETMPFLRRASDSGFASAQYSLGFAYYYGIGGREDRAVALRLYQLAADQGHSAAQRELGRMYDRGEGVQRDPTAAFRLMLYAAENGDMAAQVMVAQKYSNGHGVAQNETEARRWFRQAARQGSELSQDYLRQRNESW